MSFKAICHLSSPVLVFYAISPQMNPSFIVSVYTEHKQAQSLTSGHKSLPLLSGLNSTTPSMPA